MSRLLRVVIGIGILELMLAGIWYYLHRDLAATGDNSPESAGALGQMMGGAMGAVLGFAILLYFLRWMKERRDGKR
ncbi:MAG TPA: hypothetical protein VEX35_06165 [Allosphingosinicella sp.]|nr:hypothetical protein [Allosphingosinicella sp.]